MHAAVLRTAQGMARYEARLANADAPDIDVGPPHMRTSMHALQVIDASPSYLYSGEAAARIHAAYEPQHAQHRILVVLRDPLARAHSAFRRAAKAGCSRTQD